MSLARSFPPLARPCARVLILGSMPGVASLEAQQYYAHPRNAFWPIMGELFGARAELPYAERCGLLTGAGVAVWDVLQECRREGSLDSRIERETERVNDFSRFLAGHSRISRVLLNGQKAHDTFRRRALPELPVEVAERLAIIKLPSTSPANAGWSFGRKLAAWRNALAGGAPSG